jgi:flagellar hook-associated protein 3 FlgL
MQISTNEFLLGSLNDMLNQQSNINQLNREIATGQTMLDASADPAGASAAIGDAAAIGRFNYDSGNATAATSSLQNGLSALQQVTTLLDQLNQTAVQAASAGTTSSDRQSLTASAQAAQQQLMQLANTTGPDGGYLFGGTLTNGPPFSAQANGEVVFNGDAGTNLVEIAPSLTVPSTVSGDGIFTNIPAGDDGVAVTADASNTGAGYAVAEGVTNISQLTAARLGGTQYQIGFASAGGGNLSYTVTSGVGAPGSGGFSATSGIVASGAFSPDSDLTFGGIDIKINGTPAAGDSFDVATGATTSMFQVVQNLISALQTAPADAASNAQFQQQIENTIAGLGGAQTSALSAQASIGSVLSEIQAVQGQDTTQNTNAQSQLSDLQSANLPQVIANYSESVTALQAAQLAFAKVQGLSLFDFIQA